MITKGVLVVLGWQVGEALLESNLVIFIKD